MGNEAIENYYDELGVSPNASTGEINAAIDKASKGVDKNENMDDQQKQEEQERYARMQRMLSDPKLRKKYDQSLAAQTIMVSPQGRQPGGQPNQFMPVSGKDLQDIAKAFKDFVEGNYDGVIKKDNEEPSLEDKDKLDQNTMQFGLKEKPNELVMSFPDEESCQECREELIENRFITRMEPRPGANLGKEEEEEEQQQQQEEEQATKEETLQQQNEESASETSKLGATPTLKPPIG